MANLFYSIGPFISAPEEGGGRVWRSPDGCVGLIDLAKSSDFGTNPNSDRPVSFFASTTQLGSAYTTLNPSASGDLREIAATSLMKTAWRSATGFTPSGDTLLDLLADHLTTGADPAGADACKPLMPTVRGALEIHLAGHSVVWSQKLTPNHPHWNKHVAQIQRQLNEARQLAHNGKLIDPTTRQVNREYHLKVADALMDKFRRMGVTDFELIKPKAWGKDEKPIKHSTTIIDNFDRADADAMGSSSEGWSWAEVTGDIDIIGNQAAGQAAGSSARAEIDLSSADHSAQIVRTDSTGTSFYASGAVRFSPLATTHYLGTWRITGVSGIFKREAGTFTELTNDNTSESAANTYSMQANGSTITALRNGAIDSTVTDVSIASNLRSGMYLSGTAITGDNFQASDLASGQPARKRFGAFESVGIKGVW